MVLSAVGRALAVLTTRCLALLAPLLAGEEGQRERVFGDVGLEAVGANAAVRQGLLARGSAKGHLLAFGKKDTYGIASVGQEAAGRNLLADNGAGAELVCTPSFFTCTLAMLRSPCVYMYETPSGSIEHTSQPKRNTAGVDVVVGGHSNRAGKCQDRYSERDHSDLCRRELRAAGGLRVGDRTIQEDLSVRFDVGAS